MAKSHWLDAVVAVLRADVSDLRTLAEIAGGDPRTFYIGTDLAGVDLRGQDLRGMIFSSLDGARTDHRTMLDGDASVRRPAAALNDGEDESLRADALYVGSYELFVDIVRSGVDLGLEVFPPEKVNAFEVYAGLSRVDAYAVSFLGDDEDQFTALTSNVLTIILRSTPELVFSLHEQDMLRKVSGRAIVLPRSRFGGRRAQVLDLRDALRVLRVCGDRSSKQGASVLLRARGAAGRRPLLDAFVQLHKRLSDFEIGRSGVELFAFRAMNDAEYHLAQLLFPGAKIHECARELPSLPDAAILTDAVDIAALPLPSGGFSLERGAEYARIVASVLEFNGWSVRLSSYKRTPANIADLDIVSSHDSSAFRIMFHEPRVQKLPADGVLSDLSSLEHVDRLVVVEDFDFTSAVATWVFDRAWTVTLRELVEFRSSSGSIWSLLRRQLRNQTRSTAARGRKEYMRVVLQALLARVSRASVQPLELLGGPSRKYDVSLRRISERGDLTFLVFRCVDTSQSEGAAQSAMEIEMALGDTGPMLGDFYPALAYE